MPVCQYCGEQANALKNHVRLSSGNGHGPSGQYPDGFGDPEDGGPDGPGTGSEAQNRGGDPSPGGAYGRPGETSDVGDESPQSPVAPDPTTETPTTDVHPEGVDGETADATPDLQSTGRPDELDTYHADDGCPDCGAELVDFTDLETGRRHEVQGHSVYVAGDYVCSDPQCGEWWVDR